MKYILILPLIIFICQGCFTSMSRALVPDVNPKMEKEELAHLNSINTQSNATLLSLASIDDFELKDKKLFVKALDQLNKRATNIQPSLARTGLSQGLAMVGQQNVEEGLRTGFEWTKGTIGQLAGAGAGATGLGWLVPMLMGRKRKRMQLTEVEILKEVVREKNLRKVVEEKAKHTEVEGKIV